MTARAGRADISVPAQYTVLHRSTSVSFFQSFCSYSDWDFMQIVPIMPEKNMSELKLHQQYMQLFEVIHQVEPSCQPEAAVNKESIWKDKPMNQQQ